MQLLKTLAALGVSALIMGAADQARALSLLDGTRFVQAATPFAQAQGAASVLAPFGDFFFDASTSGGAVAAISALGPPGAPLAAMDFTLTLAGPDIPADALTADATALREVEGIGAPGVLELLFERSAATGLHAPVSEPFVARIAFDAVTDPIGGAGYGQQGARLQLFETAPRAAIPVPAAGLLLLTAGGALILARRRGAG